MKRCPKCQRQYNDDTLKFCLQDGTALAEIIRDSNPPATEILPRGAPTVKASGSTVPSYMSGGDLVSGQREPPRSNTVLTAGVVVIAILLLALVGLAAFFVLRQSSGNEARPYPDAQSSPAQTSSPANTGRTRNAGEVPTPETTQIVSPNGTPLKITASASSMRLAVQSNTYYPSNAIDGKRSTAWIEGADGPGIGEWIQFDFDREITIHRILFQPGYFKSPEVWAENNRLATITAQFSNGSSRDLSFEDKMESQKFDVGGVRTRWVRFVIKSVYNGKDPDTALSEVAFEWEAPAK